MLRTLEKKKNSCDYKDILSNQNLTNCMTYIQILGLEIILHLGFPVTLSDPLKEDQNLGGMPQYVLFTFS